MLNWSPEMDKFDALLSEIREEMDRRRKGDREWVATQCGERRNAAESCLKFYSQRTSGAAEEGRQKGRTLSGMFPSHARGGSWPVFAVRWDRRVSVGTKEEGD